MCIKKFGAVCLTVALLISMPVIGNVLPAAATAEQTDVEVFEADFTGWNSGGSGVNFLNGSTALQTYLLGKFAFYRNQEGAYFERPHVNGYVADESGNSITTLNATNTTAAYAPDTGMAMDGDQYLDYTGNGYGPLAQWGLEWNQLMVVDRTGLDAYRNSNWMYLKDTNGDLASLKNFRLEVKFHSFTGVTNGTFAVMFRAATAGNPLGSTETEANQQLLSVDPVNGGVFFGKSFVRNTSTHSESMGGAMTTNWHTATIEVVNDTLTMTIADLTTGETVFTTQKTLSVLDSGYLGIGGSLGGVAYQTIKVTRLDRNGDPIDFSDKSDGWDFHANFNGLGIYRGSHQWLMGAASAVKGYYRDNGGADFAWLEKVNTSTGEWPLKDLNAENTYDKAVLDYLNSKFNLRFEGQGWSRSNDLTLNTSISGYSQTGSANLYLVDGKYLRAVYSAQGTDGQNVIQKAMSLVPKKTDGSAYSLRDFETEFTLGLSEGNTSGMYANSSVATLYFRTSAFQASNVAGSALVFSRQGYQLFDGTGPGNKETYSFTAWANNATPENLRVAVKAVGTALTLKVTSMDGATAYADTTLTISEGAAGYLYYTLINYNNEIGEIGLREVTAPVQADNTVVIDAENDLVKVKVGAGYQVAPGSLLVKDGDNTYVPVRVGFQSEENTQSAQYQVLNADGTAMNLTDTMVGEANFVADTNATVAGSMGFLGTSVNTEKSGLRFVHRMNITSDAEGSYITANNTKQKIKDYGILVAAQAVLQNPEDLDIETANASMHIAQFYYLDGTGYNTELGDTIKTDQYYDISDSYVDISMMVTGITEAIDDYVFITRTYVVLEDDTVVYGDAVISSYAAAQ